MEDLKSKLKESKAYLKVKEGMNITTFEYEYKAVDITDDILEVIKEKESLERQLSNLKKAFDIKDRVHNQLNKDYVKLRNERRP